MKLILTGILAGFLAATAAHADEMVFTSWGGTTQE
ncbi:MAG: ABC transporter substrate-binding protein, partial [Mesorhizobium sp.]